MSNAKPAAVLWQPSLSKPQNFRYAIRLLYSLETTEHVNTIRTKYGAEPPIIDRGICLQRSLPESLLPLYERVLSEIAATFPPFELPTEQPQRSFKDVLKTVGFCVGSAKPLRKIEWDLKEHLESPIVREKVASNWPTSDGRKRNIKADFAWKKAKHTLWIREGVDKTTSETMHKLLKKNHLKGIGDISIVGLALWRYPISWSVRRENLAHVKEDLEPYRKFLFVGVSKNRADYLRKKSLSTSETTIPVES